MNKFKIGDEVYVPKYGATGIITRVNKDYLHTGYPLYSYSCKFNQIVYVMSTQNPCSEILGGIDYHLERDFISLEVYNSPLYKVLNELDNES